jgi:hypothetical protein
MYSFVNAGNVNNAGNASNANNVKHDLNFGNENSECNKMTN